MREDCTTGQAPCLLEPAREDSETVQDILLRRAIDSIGTRNRAPVPGVEAGEVHALDQSPRQRHAPLQLDPVQPALRRAIRSDCTTQKNWQSRPVTEFGDFRPIFEPLLIQSKLPQLRLIHKIDSTSLYDRMKFEMFTTPSYQR